MGTVDTDIVLAFPKVNHTNKFPLVEILMGFFIGLWCNGSTREFGSFSIGSNPVSPTMSKGRKYCTPKRHWRKLGKGNGRPWFARPTWRKTTPHVMSKSHKKFKWFFRCKKWFKDGSLKRMSMRFPMSHEIWGWD